MAGCDFMDGLSVDSYSQESRLKYSYPCQLEPFSRSKSVQNAANVDEHAKRFLYLNFRPLRLRSKSIVGLNLVLYVVQELVARFQTATCWFCQQQVFVC